MANDEKRERHINFDKETPSDAEWASLGELDELSLRKVPDDLVLPDCVRALVIDKLSIAAKGDQLIIPEALFDLRPRALEIWDADMSDVVRFTSVSDLWVVVKDPDKDTERLAAGLPGLTRLEIWGSHLKEGTLSETINTFEQLEHLALVSCGLKTLPKLTLPKLKSLELRGLPMNTFPEAVCALPALERLQFRQKTNFLPEALEQMRALKALNLCGALNKGVMVSSFDEVEHLKQIPAVIAKMTWLDSLDLSQCGVCDVSPLASLTELRSLKLCWNGITDLEPLRKLTKLETLDLEYTDRCEDFRPLEALSEMRELGLSNCDQLRSLSFVANMPRLTSLDLNGCEKIEDAAALIAHEPQLELRAEDELAERFARRALSRGLPDEGELISRVNDGDVSVLAPLATWVELNTTQALHGLSKLFPAPPAASEAEDDDEEDYYEDDDLPRQGMETAKITALVEQAHDPEVLLSFIEGVLRDTSDEIPALVVAQSKLDPEHLTRVSAAFLKAKEAANERRYQTDRPVRLSSSSKALLAGFERASAPALLPLVEEANAEDSLGSMRPLWWKLFASVDQHPDLVAATMKRFEWLLTKHHFVDDELASLLQSASAHASGDVVALVEQLAQDIAAERAIFDALHSKELERIRAVMHALVEGKLSQKERAQAFDHLRFKPDFGIDRDLACALLRTALEAEERYLTRQAFLWLFHDDIERSVELVSALADASEGNKKILLHQLRVSTKNAPEENPTVHDALVELADALEGIDPEVSKRRELEGRLSRTSQEGLAAFLPAMDAATAADMEVNLGKDDRLFMLSHALVGAYHEAERSGDGWEHVYGVLDRFARFSGSNNLKQRLLRDLVGICVRSENAERIEQALSLLPPIDEVEVDALAFNMACYFAKVERKAELLVWTARAIDLGKAEAQFLSDEDFSAFLEDEDFRNEIARGR